MRILRLLPALLPLLAACGAHAASPAVTARCTAVAAPAPGAVGTAEERAAYAVGRDEEDALELLALMTGAAPCDEIAVTSGTLADAEDSPPATWRAVPPWRPGLSPRPVGRSHAL